MAKKIGEDFARDMLDRGRRELGGILYHDSNIAQPMYPLRGTYGESKDAESSQPEQPSILDDRLARTHDGRDDPGRGGRDLDRE